ncbi:lipase class 3 family protein [Vararia minispora EC-137]|uniref:Lipase class 3 family protein n=1 Tax=Vararia minispora EC-137 TaxID=1314806 RepID=A0ACB8QDU2_9AGAM|nr:lipase class 3 family protein [Vararia minispora EC-137]
MAARSLVICTLLAASVLTAFVPERRQSAISAAQIASYKPYSYYAATAYCTPAVTLSWSCGSNCDANSGFKPVASGGDGSSVPYWFVGYDSSLNRAIVTHSGTNTSSVSWLSDINVFLGSLDSNRFPGIDGSIEVHDGFANAQASSAEDILSAVNQVISTFGATSVTVIGHSLGAAIAQIEAVYLSLHLSSDISINIVGYGMPRVGNQAWADYVDATQNVVRINNKEDPVPIVPGRFLGYHHSSGEVHILDSGDWYACPGQDNTSDLCSTGDVPNIFQSNESNHDGPYDGVMLGRAACVL